MKRLPRLLWYPHFGVWIHVGDPIVLLGITVRVGTFFRRWILLRKKFKDIIQ